MKFTAKQMLVRVLPIGLVLGISVGWFFAAIVGSGEKFVSGLLFGSAAGVFTGLGAYFCFRTQRFARAFVYAYLWSVLPPALVTGAAMMAGGILGAQETGNDWRQNLSMAAFVAFYGAIAGFVASFVIVPYVAILHPNRKLRPE